jgi:hypothetical protein
MISPHRPEVLAMKLRVLFATLAVALVPLAARAQPVDGIWEGPTYHLQPFTFTVGNSGTTVSNIKFKIVSCNTVSFTLPGPYAITANTVNTGTTGGLCPSVNTTITFSSTTTATGDIIISYNQADPQSCGCAGNGAGSVPVLSASPGIRGDANGNGTIDVNDVFYLINALFAGGTAPPTTKAGDANSNSTVDVNDVFFLINYLFAGGPPPA